MEPLESEEQLVDRSGGRSSASDGSSLSGFNSPDGLGEPEDYCKQVCLCAGLCLYYLALDVCVAVVCSDASLVVSRS